uniref:Uncharacterized protein n=1 Tax=viral metagenome TaxID=1070528 RepID=A0A6H1ZUS7_9ZZZZ
MIKYSCNLCKKDITDEKRFKTIDLISKNIGIEGNPQICCKVVFDELKEDISFCHHCIIKTIALMAQEKLKNYEKDWGHWQDDDSDYSDDRVYFPGERQLDCRIDGFIGAELDSAGRNVQNSVSKI